MILGLEDASTDLFEETDFAEAEGQQSNAVRISR